MTGVGKDAVEMKRRAMFTLDWRDIFMPGDSILATIVRGSLVYLTLLLLMRFFLRREVGAVGISDILVVVLIADAVQNAMAVNHKSVVDGVILAATIVGWDYGLDRLGYRFPALHRFLRPPPVPLIKDGKMLRQNMRRELITV